MAIEKKTATLGDTAFLVFAVSILAFIFATAFETAYLKTFGIPSETAQWIVQIGPNNYFYSLVPLLLIIYLMTSLIDTKIMNVFHKHFSYQNPNKTGLIIIFILLIVITLVGVVLPARIPNSLVQFLGILLVGLMYTVLVLELWVYKESPFELLSNHKTKIEGWSFLVLFLFIANTGTHLLGSSMGRLLAQENKTFGTIRYADEERVVIRRYGDNLVTLPYEKNRLKRSGLKLIPVSSLEKYELTSTNTTIE